jgi:transposase
MNRSSGRFDETDRRAEMKTGLADFSAIEKTGCDRRSWTREEKLRIVEEAAHPANSVSAVARRHDVNANLLHTWIRQAAQGKLGAPAPSRGARGAAFLPVGVIGFSRDDGKEPAAPVVANIASAIAEPSKSSSAPSLQPRDRWGLIEIDLQNGARVRVDASVDEKALRCVLSVIKGMA